MSFREYLNFTSGTEIKPVSLQEIVTLPFKPNMTEIAMAIGADRGSVSDYFVYMEKAGLISRLRHADDKMALLEKIDKIYLSNPTLCCSQSDGKPDIGNLRETAFLSLMRVKVPQHDSVMGVWIKLLALPQLKKIRFLSFNEQ